MHQCNNYILLHFHNYYPLLVQVSLSLFRLLPFLPFSNLRLSSFLLSSIQVVTAVYFPIPMLYSVCCSCCLCFQNQLLLQCKMYRLHLHLFPFRPCIMVLKMMAIPTQYLQTVLRYCIPNYRNST